MGNLFIFSYVAMWVLVVLLYGAVFILYGHVGREMLARDKAAGGPSLNSVLDITLASLDGAYTLGKTTKQPHMVLFASPNCNPCLRIQPFLADICRDHKQVLLLVVYAGDEESSREYVKAIPEKTIVVSDYDRDLARKWNVSSTPYAVAVASQGVVKKKGVVTSLEALKAMCVAAQEN